MLAVFNMDGRLDFSIESLKFDDFCGNTVSWQALEDFNFKISLRISSLCIFEKEKGSLRFLFQTSPIASMLGYILKQDH